jgi:Fe-S-cluster containining protein
VETLWRPPALSRYNRNTDRLARDSGGEISGEVSAPEPRAQPAATRKPLPATALNGIRFACQPGCTKCCDRQGFVYLTEADIERIAGHLGLPQAEFEERFVFRTRRLRRLRVPRHAQCWFLRDGGCSIHAVKPIQCAAFPYWPEILDSRRKWEDTGKMCPGIGQGELVNIEAAHRTAEEMRHAHPELYQA